MRRPKISDLISFADFDLDGAIFGLLDSWEGGICQGIDIYATYAEIIGICCEWSGPFFRQGGSNLAWLPDN